MDNTTSAAEKQTNQTCALCEECPGFEPHFWKQSTCAKCRHPISDHNWKKYETSSLTLSAEFPQELYKKDDDYRVILYNDENTSFDKVIAQIKKAFLQVAKKKISSDDAEELATQAHMNGGTRIYSGTESECFEFRQILAEISLECEVETPNNIVIHATNENSALNRLLVLHYTTSHQLTIGTLLTKLTNALGFNKDKAKYICHVTAIEGKINLYCGPLHQCVLISRLLHPLKTTIQGGKNLGKGLKIDIDRVLSLCDQTQLVLVKKFEEVNLSLLPMEVADSIFHLAFVSGWGFNLKHLQHYLSSFQIKELNLCASSINHEEALPCIKDEWLEAISQCKTIQSLNLNFCCSKVTLNGLQHLSSLNIVSLSLENCNLSDLDVSKFPRLFPFLKHLSLAHSKRLTTQCAPCFEQLYALESLNIQHTSINVTVEYLKQKMPQLVHVVANEQKQKQEGRTAALFAEAFDRIRDRLPNQREVGEEQINLMFGNELRLMLAQNPALLRLLVQEEEEEDQDEEEEESDSEDENEDADLE